MGHQLLDNPPPASDVPKATRDTESNDVQGTTSIETKLAISDTLSWHTITHPAHLVITVLRSRMWVSGCLGHARVI